MSDEARDISTSPRDHDALARSSRSERETEDDGAAFRRLVRDFTEEAVRDQVTIPHTSETRATSVIQHLVEQIRTFEDGLDDEHDVGVQLMALGQAVAFHVRQITAIGPDHLVFDGATEEGSPVRLVQHVGQVNFVLRRMPRIDAAAPRRAIGFVIASAGEPPVETAG